MNLRKGSLIFLFALVVLLFFCACGVSQEANGAEQSAQDSMYNEKQGTSVSLGLQREEVEDLLGEASLVENQSLALDGFYQSIPRAPSEQTPMVFYDYGSLQIGYQNDRVTAIVTSSIAQGTEKESNWSVKQGLSLGANEALLFESYGERTMIPCLPDEAGTTRFLVEYFYDEAGTPVEDPTTASYMLAFVLSERTVVYCAILSVLPA